MFTDFQTWAQDNSETIFRFLVYRRMFTPYEIDNKFIDDTEFADTHYSFGKIEDVIELGPNEWLIGLRSVDEDDFSPYDNVTYYRLSEIRLEKFDKDNTGHDSDDEDTDEL